MDRERNICSIRAIEKHVEEPKKTLFKLNHTRTPLSNISTLIPPEILGIIFCWAVILQRKQGTGWRRVSYNFLLVCRYWFDVASRTPQLWISWGDNLRDWEQRCSCLETARLDLELKRDYLIASQALDERLWDALRGRAARGSIGQIELHGNPVLINSVISSITASGERTRPISLESFTLCSSSQAEPTIELSGFFACYRFPELWRLQLLGPWNISSWDSLAFGTGGLTTLSLSVNHRSGTRPTTSQLLSLLSSNPNLQCLDLSNDAIPDSTNDESSLGVQLRQLKRIKLSGGSRDVVLLLSRLTHSDRVENLNLDLFGSTTLEISQILGPYLGDHLRRRGGLGEGLAVGGNCTEAVFFFRAGDVRGFTSPFLSRGVNWFLEVIGTMEEGGGPQGEECERLFFEPLTCVPKRHIVHYEAPFCLLKSAEPTIKIFNLVEAHFTRVHLPEWFTEPHPVEKRTYGKLFPSLKYLSLHGPTLGGGDWSPLMTFLSCRASAGNQVDTLSIRECPHMCPDVWEDIRGLVNSFQVSWSAAPEHSACSHGKCLEPEDEWDENSGWGITF